MSYEIVHTIGSTVYFVVFVLFVWMSRVPRTNPGAGWWGLAMLFALLARLSFLVLASADNPQFTVSVYSALNAVEKLFLVVGLVRFLGLPVSLRGFVVATLAIEVWIGTVWCGGFPPMARSMGLALFNAVFLTFVAWVTYRKRHALSAPLMCITSAASVLLTVHWLTGFAIVSIHSDWFRHGFLLGTLLVLVQYLSLLAAVLVSFQKRLLEAESRALDMAFEDPLTGLNNQRYMTTLFDKVLALATRSQQLVAIIYIDLDNFKPINDKAGHAVGDEVLKIIAQRLRHSTRSADICARIGGDEFVAICTQLEHPDQVHEIVGKLLQEVTRAITVKGRDYVLGASVGVSLYPLHGNSLAKLLEYADQAMYQIKRSGKNGYRIHEVQVPAHAQQDGGA